MGRFDLELIIAHHQHATLLELGIDRAHMVGTSYGGELNLVMGIHHPERCRSLVIITSLSPNHLFPVVPARQAYSHCASVGRR